MLNPIFDWAEITCTYVEIHCPLNVIGLDGLFKHANECRGSFLKKLQSEAKMI